MKSTFSLFSSSLHGCGVKADVEYNINDIILIEKPLFFLQTIPNRKYLILCNTCLKPLGNLKLQLSILQGLVSRQNILQEYDHYLNDYLIDEIKVHNKIISCTNNCGELYCSEQCRDFHWSMKGHCMLCTGLITDDEADSHPLMNFKIHATSTNEIFLMVADIFATICCQLDNLINSDGMNLQDAFDIVHKPFHGYVRELWWNAAITPKGMKSNIFKNSLKSLVHETWILLNEVLNLDKKGYSLFLNEEYMARTIGMFEQNNVGVQMKSYVAYYIEELTNGILPNASRNIENCLYLNDATERILDNIEDNDVMCCDDDDDEDEDDDENENTVEAMIDDTNEKDNMIDTTTLDIVEDNMYLKSLKDLIDIHDIDNLYPPIDGTAFYSIICRINHSCEPNVQVLYQCSHEHHHVQAYLKVLKPIQPNEELLQSYINQYDSYVIRKKSLADYGFECNCNKCIAKI